MMEREYMKALGRCIRDVRRKRGITISDLHYEVRMARQSVVKIERGDVIPRLESILSICQALEIKPGALFEMADSEL